jgi:hypothetical protein
VTLTRNGVTTTFASGTLATFRFTPSDDGLYTVFLTVRRGTTTLVGSDTKAISVLNVAPTAAFTAPLNARANRSFILRLLSANDASSIDRSSGFAFAYDCGDGLGLRSNLTASITCQSPSTTGSIIVRARISDKDGASSVYGLTLPIVP